MEFNKILSLVCLLYACVVLYTYLESNLHQSDKKKFSLILPALKTIGDTRKKACLRIACMAPRYVTGGGTYYMRCKQLEILGNTYFEDIKVELMNYDQAVKVQKQYDAAIFIKTTPDLKWWPKIWRSFKKIYVDVIDGNPKNGSKNQVGSSINPLIDFDNLKTMSPQATLIVQNVYQQLLYNASFHTIIIEHMPASLNDSEWVSTSSLAHPLRAISSMRRHSASICKNIRTSSVILKCVDTDYEWTEITWRKLLEGVKLNITYKDYLSKVWGQPWLFTQMYRKYDVVVVYTKKGRKEWINSVQRMTNAIDSGVLTAIQRTGLHKLYVPESYGCGFTDNNELTNVLENLDQNISLREECQRQAKLINAPFSHKNILDKYHRMLTSAT